MKYLFSLILAVSSICAYACSCANPGAINEEQYSHYDFIAKGVVKGIQGGEMENIISFAVEEAFKGTEDDIRVKIETASSSAACGLSVSVGEEWLIYANSHETGLHVSLCSRSVVLSAEGMSGVPKRAKDDLKFLNQKKENTTDVIEKGKAENTQSYTIGDIRRIHSKVLGEERVLNVYLPEDYSEDSSYSVIYLLDGSRNEDFLHVAGLLQFSNYPWLNFMPGSILVGIENVDRKRDFTYPSRDEKYREKYPTTGESAGFIQFIETELKPYIEASYPVNKVDMLIGQSLGGLLATEILYKKPDMFEHYFIVSPSLWYDSHSLLENEPVFLQEDFEKNLSVYIAVGNEGRVMKKAAKRLYRSVKGEENIKSQFEYFSSEDHASVLHQALYLGFKEFSERTAEME